MIYFLTISTFLVTAIYDLVLQVCIKNPDFFLNKLIGDSDWLISLKKYFPLHTPLSAALLAGFIGAFAQLIILQLVDFKFSIKFLVVTFIVSGALGFVMNDAYQTSFGMYPHLSKTYYKDLGKQRSFITDAQSGMVVQLTMLIVVWGMRSISNKT